MLAHRTVSAVKDSAHTDVAKLESQRDSQELSVIVMRIALEREKLPAAFVNQPSTHISQSASHL